MGIDRGQIGLEDYLYAQISAPLDGITYARADTASETGFDLDAKAAISLRAGAAGREHVIFKKNITEVLPIASLTKLMTATVVLENPEIYDPDAPVAISAAAANQDDVPLFGNLMAGESHTVRHLLNLMLFYSSNDAAYALAEVMGGEQFVEAMNRKAAAIGLKNTKFYNSHGLDRDDNLDNYSTVSDLLTLVKYILGNHPEIFSFSIQPGGPYLTENGIFDPKLWDGQKLVGGKTGYTEKAGGCLIMVFEDEKQNRYINILLGSSSSESRVAEMQKLINFVNNSAN